MRVGGRGGGLFVSTAKAQHMFAKRPGTLLSYVQFFDTELLVLQFIILKKTF